MLSGARRKLRGTKIASLGGRRIRPSLPLPGESFSDHGLPSRLPAYKLLHTGITHAKESLSSRHRPPHLREDFSNIGGNFRLDGPGEGGRTVPPTFASGPTCRPGGWLRCSKRRAYSPSSCRNRASICAKDTDSRSDSIPSKPSSRRPAKPVAGRTEGGFGYWSTDHGTSGTSTLVASACWPDW